MGVGACRRAAAKAVPSSWPEWGAFRSLTTASREPFPTPYHTRMTAVEADGGVWPPPRTRLDDAAVLLSAQQCIDTCTYGAANVALVKGLVLDAVDEADGAVLLPNADAKADTTRADARVARVQRMDVSALFLALCVRIDDLYCQTHSRCAEDEHTDYLIAQTLVYALLHVHTLQRAAFDASAARAVGPAVADVDGPQEAPNDIPQPPPFISTMHLRAACGITTHSSRALLWCVFNLPAHTARDTGLHAALNDVSLSRADAVRPRSCLQQAIYSAHLPRPLPRDSSQFPTGRSRDETAAASFHVVLRVLANTTEFALSHARGDGDATALHDAVALMAFITNPRHSQTNVPGYEVRELSLALVRQLCARDDGSGVLVYARAKGDSTGARTAAMLTPRQTALAIGRFWNRTERGNPNGEPSLGDDVRTPPQLKLIFDALTHTEVRVEAYRKKLHRALERTEALTSALPVRTLQALVLTYLLAPVEPDTWPVWAQQPIQPRWA